MNSSENKYDPIEQLIFNEGLQIVSVYFDEPNKRMIARLNNDHQLIIPIAAYHNLSNGSASALMNYHLVAGGTGIHWPELDEDLSLKGFLKDYLKQQVAHEHILSLEYE